MSIKILHTGDWHLGNFHGPEKNGENARYQDVCNCLDALVESAKAELPDAIIVAGDLFHQAKVWSDRGLKESQRIISTIRELAAIAPVVVMRGTPNHDSEEQFNALRTAFEGDSRVHIFTEPGVETIYTKPLGDPIQIACVPGFDRGYYRAKHPGLSKEEENEVFTEAIANLILGMKAQCQPGIPSVLVGHYTITGANMESGQTAFMAQFEPVVYPETLKAADYDLVCFGHIHRPQQLEGCRNTFYSGAISALNFNDEGQARGCYYHEINGDGSVTTSFQELPTRLFKTLRLTDEDITAINNSDFTVLNTEDRRTFADCIVRVLYDCTDEHNKAFNHATLENYLYQHGAFWVQEITPQKITITVDKKALESDDSPEANLTAYLEEKGFEPDKIGELIELAGPIIAEASEKTTTERRSGVFVPVEIDVHNYRNYRDETFSYDSISFCTINGQNGVGKSSLFMDAMLDCLYEEPREGELTGWICNDPAARSGSIKLTFRLGESLYRITRTRQKSGKATLNVAELVDGEWTDRSKEKYRDTQTEILNILGMDSLTLKACALIMQDQYGLFLQADKEARMAILGSILGLGIYGVMEDLAAAAFTETNRTIRTYADKADVLTAGLPDMDAIAAEITEYENGMEEITATLRRYQLERNAIQTRITVQKEAAERVVKLRSRISTLTANKAAKEGQKSTQAAIITGADAILAQETAIMEGVQQYQSLCEQEKAGISIEAEYKAVQADLRKAKEDLSEYSRASEDAITKRTKVADRILKLQETLANEPEISAKHDEYSGIKQILIEMEELEATHREKKEALKAAQTRLSDLQKELTHQKGAFAIRIEMLENKAAMLENSGCPDTQNATCRFLKDAQAAKAELPEVKAELEAVISKIENQIREAEDAVTTATADVESVKYDPETHSALKSDLKLLELFEAEYSNLTAAKSELDTLTERLHELTGAADAADDKMADAKNRIEVLTSRIEAMDAQISEIESIRAKIAVAKQWLEKEKQLPLARSQKEAASSRLFELIAEIGAIETEISDCESDLAKEQTATENIEQLKAEDMDYYTKIRQYEMQENETTMRIGALRLQQEQIKERLKQAEEMQQAINDLGVTAAGYDTLKKAFSQDGIPHNIIRSIIPVFEATATNILGQMSGGKMSVEFITERVLKSNNKKEVTTLDIIISDTDTGRLPYMSRSGGERVKAALSVILALAEIKSNKAGIQLGFLFIDEPPFLDQQGVQAYCDALETIQQRYSGLKIMAITHDPAMKARFPQSLDVVKTAEGSKVIY